MAWHAPLFLMVGYFSGWDFAPDSTWFAFNIIVGAVLYTWVYNNASRSVLAAILFHFVGNATEQFLEHSPAADRYQTVATVGLVLVVLLWWGRGISVTGRNACSRRTDGNVRTGFVENPPQSALTTCSRSAAVASEPVTCPFSRTETGNSS